MPWRITTLNMKKALANERYGRLVAIKPTGLRYNRYVVWQCRCDCGKVISLNSGSLLSGNTRSCGCLLKDVLVSRNTTHNKSKDPIYNVWSSMIQRCTNPRFRQYKDYGGRGIKPSEDWRTFENFFRDMSGTHSQKLTLERLDNTKGYNKENCKWATRTEQNNNKRNNHVINIQGERRTVSEWSRLYGIKRSTISSWINRDKKVPEEVISLIVKQKI